MMDLEELKEALKAFEKKVEDSIAFYKELQKKPLPDVIEVGDYASNAIGGIIELTDAETMGEWNKRAINIKQVNATLDQFDMNLQNNLLRGDGAILANEILRCLKMLQFVLSHLGEMTIIAYDVVKLFIEGMLKMGDDFAGYVLTGGWTKDLLNTVFHPVQTRDRVKKKAGEIKDWIQETALKLLTMAALGVMLGYLKTMMDVVSEANYYKTLVPLNRLRFEAIELMKLRAFPQGSGRVRRWRRSRKN